jgi:CRISPR/Cas system CMR subunit Cmr4 (Cas7 group RAMP superfamily)
MKLYYILLFVSTFAFGQINTETIAGKTWYKVSTTDGIIVYSVFKKNQNRGVQITLHSDQSFSIPKRARPRRCANHITKNTKTRNRVSTRNRTTNTVFEKGTWTIEIIDGESILVLDSKYRHQLYKILYASSSTLELQRYF